MWIKYVYFANIKGWTELASELIKVNSMCSKICSCPFALVSQHLLTAAKGLACLGRCASCQDPPANPTSLNLCALTAGIKSMKPYFLFIPVTIRSWRLLDYSRSLDQPVCLISSAFPNPTPIPALSLKSASLISHIMVIISYHSSWLTPLFLFLFSYWLDIHKIDQWFRKLFAMQF